MGDCPVEASDDRWVLLGDGAQSSVSLTVIRSDKRFPEIYRLEIGPIWNGLPIGKGGGSALYRYDYFRTPTGWKRLKYDRRIIR